MIIGFAQTSSGLAPIEYTQNDNAIIAFDETSSQFVLEPSVSLGRYFNKFDQGEVKGFCRTLINAFPGSLGVIFSEFGYYVYYPAEGEYGDLIHVLSDGTTEGYTYERFEYDS